MSDHLQARDGKGLLTTAGQVPPGTQDTPVPASSLLGSVRQGPREPLAPPAPHAYTFPHRGDSAGLHVTVGRLVLPTAGVG